MYTTDGLRVDEREFLKVKVLSLAEEARIIRREERKARWLTREQMHNHRVNVVRREARCAHLAYGFLRGRTYDQMERTYKSQPNFRRVGELLRKYGRFGWELRVVPVEESNRTTVAYVRTDQG